MDYDFYNPYLLNKLDTIDAEELMATPYACLLYTSDAADD